MDRKHNDFDCKMLNLSQADITSSQNQKLTLVQYERGNVIILIVNIKSEPSGQNKFAESESNGWFNMDKEM